ncbi:MAG: di-heme oxidoredictase family protein [Planctomycetota bacterium]
MRRSKQSLVVACLILAPLFSSSSVAQIPPQPRMGDPITGLTVEQLARFWSGKADFEQTLAPSEGLGPTFNQTSCGSCHNTPATGGAGTISVTRFGLARTGSPFDPLASLGGSLLQSQAIDDGCQETVPGIANVTTLRITTPLFGAGLVEAIDDDDILAHVATSGGFAHLIVPLEDPFGSPRVGRFGWKAQLATVLSFSGDAALNEMGLTNRLVPNENAPNGDAALLAMCDSVADPEDTADAQGFDFIDRVADFQRFLAPPPQTPRAGLSGEQVFINIGCAQCHVASGFTTATTSEAALSGVDIKPYSDFLLHDMAGLGDGIVQGDASETSMRTAALWGLRTRESLLHDGRVAGGTFAQRIAAAIGFHAGAAASAVAGWQALTPTQKSQVVAFLDTLGRREFDHDGDGDVDASDFHVFLDCVLSATTHTADEPCAISDIDQDGVVDLADFGSFLLVYEGALADCDFDGDLDLEELVTAAATDCNQNLTPDACDIDSGLSDDSNLNGVPDECEPELRNIIWCAETASGLVDSCSALGLALAEYGHASMVLTDLGAAATFVASLDATSVVWVLLGTYPNNHQLTAAEGLLLANLAGAGISIYIEGADVWGFDPVTSFGNYDGIEQTSVVDGDDSLSLLTGVAFAGLELSDLSAISYSQDQSGNDWTDRILPTATTPGAPVDFGGPGAGTVWRNDPDFPAETAYSVATFYDSGVSGKVLAQSWEFGGFNGDQGVLAALYREALQVASEPLFVRGDCNQDGAIDIADAVRLLGFLFAIAAAVDCDSACDNNDDGSTNIADVIFELSAIFLGGPLPPPPYPTCGTDSTRDTLPCRASICF